jgi:hypothetical protein
MVLDQSHLYTSTFVVWTAGSCVHHSAGFLILFCTLIEHLLCDGCVIPFTFMVHSAVFLVVSV